MTSTTKVNFQIGSNEVEAEFTTFGDNATFEVWADDQRVIDSSCFASELWSGDHMHLNGAALEAWAKGRLKKMAQDAIVSAIWSARELLEDQ